MAGCAGGTEGENLWVWGPGDLVTYDDPFHLLGSVSSAIIKRSWMLGFCKFGSPAIELTLAPSPRIGVRFLKNMAPDN